MIDSQQADNNLRPLTSFLFRCTFTAQEGDKVLTEAALKKLQYSVLSVNIPKMKEQELDELSYGSFFISFPFWSTGDQAMTIEFWETDKMEISKIFYYMLDKKRWRASSMFKYSQADLFVTVEILDQRNYLPADKHVIFSNTYALKTVSIDPPEFVRTGDVTLLKTKVEFNTMQHEYSHGNIRTGINPLGDFMDKNVYMPDENAFIDANEMSDRIAEAFSEYVQKELEKQYSTTLEEIQSAIPEFSKLRSDKGEDFILDKKELDYMYQQYKKNMGKAATMTKEDFGKMAQKNMNKLATGLHDMNVALEKSNISFVLNKVNDAESNHEWSEKNASHLTGAKADITILKNGEKVLIGSLTKEEAEKIQDAAKSAGMVFNFESTAGKQDTSLWADIHPVEFETPTGTKQRDTSWTGNFMNVHITGKDANGKESKYDRDLVSGEEIEKYATRRTAEQKKRAEETEKTKEAKQTLVKDLRDSLDKQSEKGGLYSANSTLKPPTQMTKLPDDNRKEIEAKGNSTFQSSLDILK